MKLFHRVISAQVGALSFVFLWTLALFLMPSSSSEIQTSDPITSGHLFPDQVGNWIRLGHRELAPGDLNEITREGTYSRTYEAIYVGNQGQQLMMSISYGENQLDSRFSAHRPEYCYQTQGFDVDWLADSEEFLDQSSVAIRRLVAKKPGKMEHISYWMTIADRAVLPGLDRLTQQVRLSLSGKVPDGYLVRISTDTTDEKLAFQQQHKFLSLWLADLPQQQRARLLGQEA